MSSLPILGSEQSTIRIAQIAALRARGIGEHIDLPQLVVCGDQSAGKSSVLEGITTIPFPRQDGVCTKFATEIILNHTDTNYEITASILPSSTRQDPIKSKLKQYSRSMNDFTELPEVISEVGTLMGLKGFQNITNGPAFSEDVLRIEVQGKTGMQLTIVDLPGLISVENEEQTETDVEIVQQLVDTYISSSRTIILAVVQASNDIANQRIIQKSRQVDRDGKRTLGIITKPDLINTGTEKRIALLARNEDTTKLKLGYFILKNPTPTELATGITSECRQKNEFKFFNSTPWKEQRLDNDRVGILSLKTYLQILLDQHIERELPKVRDEIRQLISTTEKDLLTLGEERPSIGHMRLFLSRISMRFHILTTSALNGTYHEVDSEFFKENEHQTSTRLRATIHRLNTSFSDKMREKGAKRVIVPKHLDALSTSNSEPGDLNEGIDDQIQVTKEEMNEWVQGVS